MKPMRITIVGGPFLPMPPAPCGAVERIWHFLAEHFVRRGHAVTVLCRIGRGQSREEVLNGVRYLRRGEWKRTSHSSWNLLKDFYYSSCVFSDLPPADILVTNAFWLPAFLSVWNPDAGRIAVHVQRMPNYQYTLYPAIHRFQTVSSAIRDAMIAQQPALKPRIRIFPNPVDTQILTPPSTQRATHEGRTILYTGRIHPEKGLDLLVEAFRRLSAEFSDLRLRLVGPWRTEQGGGGNTYRESLKSLAKDLPVEFVEPIFELNALAEEYKAADYYCYPSTAERGEASPVAPVEAMATALVPIVANIPQYRDSMENGINSVMFDHKAADPVGSLAQALHGLIVDPIRLKKLGTAAFLRASNMSYEAVTDLYLEDFERMLMMGGRRRWSASAN